jgi:hypothetical protein
MFIEITSLLELDCFDLSHSRAEGGENAGRNAWNASKEQAKETPLLDNEEKLEAMRDFARSSGGWTREEIAEWSAEEVNALFLQWVAGDVRQCPAKLGGIEFEERYAGMWYFQTPNDKLNDMEDGPHDSRHCAYKVASSELVGYNQTKRAESLDEIDWEEYEEMAMAGRVSSNLSKGDDGKISFHLGS